MWLCRRCAAHVKDEILTCPCCAMPAPARLQPELAENVSDEKSEATRRRQIDWLTLKALPNLRKRATSPWLWAVFGFAVGLACGDVHFHRSLAQPLLGATALAVVFGLLGIVLRWRQNRGILPIEVGTIIGFFIPLIYAVIDAFTNRQGWESGTYLLSILCPASALGLFLAWLGAFVAVIVVFLVKILVVPLARRLGFKDATEELPSRALEMTHALDRHESPAEMDHSDKITLRPEGFLSESDPHFGIRGKDNTEEA